jgi:hypothetical protein
MLLAGIEPTIPASERPQTHALDRAATGIGIISVTVVNNINNINLFYPAVKVFVREVATYVWTCTYRLSMSDDV